MAPKRKPQSYTGLVTLSAVAIMLLSPPDWSNEELVKGVQIAFALSFGLFNTLCFLCKRQVMKANDQRTVRVPSDDGKTSDTKSVRAYDLEAIDLMMVKGTMYYGFALWSGSYRKAFTIMVVQGLSQPLQVLDSPVFQLHFRGGDENSEALERPWKAGTFLSNMVKLQSEYERRQEAAKARLKKRLNGVQRVKRTGAAAGAGGDDKKSS